MICIHKETWAISYSLCTRGLQFGFLLVHIMELSPYEFSKQKNFPHVSSKQKKGINAFNTENRCLFPYTKTRRGLNLGHSFWVWSRPLGFVHFPLLFFLVFIFLMEIRVFIYLFFLSSWEVRFLLLLTFLLESLGIGLRVFKGHLFHHYAPFFHPLVVHLAHLHWKLNYFNLKHMIALLIIFVVVASPSFFLKLYRR